MFEFQSGGNSVDVVGFTNLLNSFGIDLKQHQLDAVTLFKVCKDE